MYSGENPHLYSNGEGGLRRWKNDSFSSFSSFRDVFLHPAGPDNNPKKINKIAREETEQLPSPAIPFIKNITKRKV